MKRLDRFLLQIFALLIGIATIIVILITTGVLEPNEVTKWIVRLADTDTQTAKVTLIASVVVLLFVLKAVCFTSKPQGAKKEDVVLENSNGKLVISKESLDNIISSVAKEIPGTESTSSRTIVDKNKDLIVYVTTVVNRDVMLKDVSVELQNRIKEVLKSTADLDVKEVNIKVKNITSKKLKGSRKVETPQETNLPEVVDEESPEENDKDEEVEVEEEE